METDRDLQYKEKKAELKELKRKNRRRNAFMVLMALQVGSFFLSYYLGRSHKD